MKRSAPMRRTGFQRRPSKVIGIDTASGPDTTVIVEVVPHAGAAVPGRIVRMAAINDEQFVGAQPKTRPVRCEEYRRLVAALPCIRCGIVGFSQAAHPNMGKGAGTKADDRECFPLCADRPGVRGCHQLLDAGAIFSKEQRRAMEKQWSAETQRRLNAGK